MAEDIPDKNQITFKNLVKQLLLCCFVENEGSAIHSERGFFSKQVFVSI